jgi:RNA polymerase sigma-70 factor (ECF subfamily)
VLETKHQQAGFEALIRQLRPQLYRFCARMTGSAADGEDILQDALLKAMQAYPGAQPLDHPEAWLFRIARNAALDFLRGRQRTQAIVIDHDDALIADPVDRIDQRQAASASLGTFMALSPVERGSVILMDVIGYSLREIADIMDSTIPAVKAALHRGRHRLRALAGTAEPAPMPVLTMRERDRLARYVERFNAHDFDAIRDLLAEDVRLELVGLKVLAGKPAVSPYFSNYARLSGWRLSLGIADGRPAILVHRAGEPTSFVLLTWAGDRIGRIQDFFHAPEALELADLRPLPGNP